jgi:dihydroorotase
MQIFIRQATIADPASPLNGLKADLFINDGIISFSSGSPSENATVIDVAGLYVAPGFTDIFAQFNDPGYEYKETLETGAAAAAAGGYTTVMVVPNTKPALDAKPQVEYVVQKSKHLPVNILPIGALTKNCEGKDLAEMYDMFSSGAVAFSDGSNPVQSSQVMMKALQYVKAFNGVVIQVPDDQNLTKSGLVNEGIISTQMGLPGKPAVAEQLMVARDIELVRYTESRIHFTGLSTAASFELVRRAKADGLHVTCSVTPYHLTFCDEDLHDYDTNLKVNPPLRTRADTEATRSAVLDGTVDCIASHHQPHEYDSKICEFEYAKYGMEGLETCFGAVAAALPQLSINKLVALFSINPAHIFNFNIPAIYEGSTASLSLFIAGEHYVFEKTMLRSVSSNNAFVGRSLRGKIFGIINGNQIIIN